MAERATPSPAPTPVSTAAAPAPAERGWGKLLIALVAFILLPKIPQLQSLLPIVETTNLLVPALAACALVGWWAGGRAFLAIAWVAVATLLVVQGNASPPTPFDNLARGWSLLLAGAFGLVCLFDATRPLFSRALATLGIALVLATVMSLVGPISLSRASKTVSDELARRNAESMSMFNAQIQAHPKEWADLVAKVPQLAEAPAQTEKQLAETADLGATIFPSMLALESLAALALAWATYHRLARARLGPPLRALRDFRFNDQLVWGLIVGLTIMLLPTLKTLHGFGKNLLVFFGALYAVRGFGVLTWFMAPGSLGVTLAVSFVLLFAPVLGAFAALALLMLGVAALALGLGDTWADWRSRARSTS
jgi:Predicted membrane protein (DUF2232)